VWTNDYAPGSLWHRLRLLLLSLVPPSQKICRDGKVSTSAKAGNVFACNQNFRGGGARHTGDWFRGTTWTPQDKPHVQGKVMWPDASLSLKAGGDSLAVTGNSLPVGQPTGTFPIAEDDPVYQFDTNPNPISAMPLNFDIPLNPQRAATPGCLPMGMIGFTLTGVPLYNALDDAGRDAAAHEVQDLCDGHPQGKGQYHYHSSSPCLPGAEENKIVGWALDGFPIIGMKDASGKELTNADLDACHGQDTDVSVDGRAYTYACRLTREYPYTMGCYSGQVSGATKQAIRAAMGLPKERMGMGENAKGGRRQDQAGARQRPGDRRPPKR
jgi:YHYH protein